MKHIVKVSDGKTALYVADTVDDFGRRVNHTRFPLEARRFSSRESAMAFADVWKKTLIDGADCFVEELSPEPAKKADVSPRFVSLHFADGSEMSGHGYSRVKIA